MGTTDQGRPKIAYLGPAASYSHQAALACFSKDENDLEPQSSIKDVFASIQSSNTAYGVVPFENSTYGTVVFTLDLLVDRKSNYPDLLVSGELYLPVHHCLVGYPSKTPSRDHASGLHNQIQANTTPHRSPKSMENLEHISTIYSHPAAFGQCEDFLSHYLQGAKKHEVSSTSKAAEIVAQEGSDGKSAAISSSLAAEVHGLKILAEGIEDKDDNSTRFFILKHRRLSDEAASLLPRVPSADGEGDAEKKWKTLISFTLPHQPSGTLADALQVFKERGLNLTSIHSRPSLEHAWHYVFLIEVQGSWEREMVGRAMKEVGDEGQGKREGEGGNGGVMDQALEELGRRTKGWKWLGSWIDRAESGG
ncbi:MAG: hypothetical protein Q9181_002896 [Wetmoreana brouardii]